MIFEGKLSKKYPKGVRFTKEGFPDFSPYSIKDVKIEYGKTRYVDFSTANKAAGFDKTPVGYTWHHSEKYGLMQLVPEELHEQVRHTGGVSIYK